jgi:hypothetical protein
MKTILSLVVFLAVTASVHGEGVLYSNPELHYSIRLPEGWRRLPPGVADQATEAVSRQTGVSAPKYEAWFQRIDKPEGAYPYLLINHQICRMPELSELVAGLKEHNQATADQRNSLKGVVSDITFFEPAIDAHRNMVVIKTEQNVKMNGTGKVHGQCCMFPGKVGVAQLFFYADADNVLSSKTDFDSVLDSFAFEPGYGYESGLATYASTRSFNFTQVLIFALIGGFIAPLISRLLKSRNPESPPRLLYLQLVFVMLIVLGGLDFLIAPPHGAIGLTFVLGSIAVGVAGIVVSRMIGVKSRSTPT